MGRAAVIDNTAAGKANSNSDKHTENWELGRGGRSVGESEVHCAIGAVGPRKLW